MSWLLASGAAPDIASAFPSLTGPLTALAVLVGGVGFMVREWSKGRAVGLELAKARAEAAEAALRTEREERTLVEQSLRGQIAQLNTKLDGQATKHSEEIQAVRDEMVQLRDEARTQRDEDRAQYRADIRARDDLHAAELDALRTKVLEERTRNHVLLEQLAVLGVTPNPRGVIDPTEIP